MERLKGKTILIGKNAEDGRLRISVSGISTNDAKIGSPGTVPNSVSRCRPNENMAHASLVINSAGELILTNMKSENVTFVNNSEIVSKVISPTDKVQLGRDRYTLNVPNVLEAARKIIDAGLQKSPQPSVKTSNEPVKAYDISHLKYIWEEYEKETKRIEKERQNNGRIRLVPIMIGSLSGVASPLLASFVAINTLFVTVPISAICFGMYIFVFNKKDSTAEDMRRAKEWLTEEYVCPNCKKYLMGESYKYLKQQLRSHKDNKMYCPKCGCEFIEES